MGQSPQLALELQSWREKCCSLFHCQAGICLEALHVPSDNFPADVVITVDNISTG